MANEKRLIDANVLYETLCRHPRHGLMVMHGPNGPEGVFFGDAGNDFANMINTAPTVDAVEVVQQWIPVTEKQPDKKEHTLYMQISGEWLWLTGTEICLVVAVKV